MASLSQLLGGSSALGTGEVTSRFDPSSGLGGGGGLNSDFPGGSIGTLTPPFGGGGAFASPIPMLPQLGGSNLGLSDILRRLRALGAFGI